MRTSFADSNVRSFCKLRADLNITDVDGKLVEFALKMTEGMVMPRTKPKLRVNEKMDVAFTISDSGSGPWTDVCMVLIAIPSPAAAMI
jgi:hypothetical protein